jgi:uncharacterized protein YdeI (YjbR/CyaY-like superfamily)
MADMARPNFFKAAREFSAWLDAHHATQAEFLVGFYKTGSAKPSMTWPEAVDAALCFGWIDGVRRRIDERRYCIRFTPRKSRSTWSAVNIARIEALTRAGRMRPAGRAAFQARRENKSGIYSYERRPEALVEPYAGLLARNAKACLFFGNQTPSYRRAAIWWVISAKKEQTRLARAGTLIELSARRQFMPQFIRTAAEKTKKR